MNVSTKRIAIVGREADVDRQRHLLRVADVGDGARLERAVGLLLDQPELRVSAVVVKA